MPNKVPNRPWEMILMDLITELPELNSYNGICVFLLTGSLKGLISFLLIVYKLRRHGMK